jgi:hypothetical protein
MDTPAPFPQDELNETERRLAGWSPAAPGVGRDRMLFEAGRAAARAEVRGRIAMIIAADFAVLAIAIVVWARENAVRERLAVALALQSQFLNTLSTTQIAAPVPGPVLPPAPVPARDSYLALTHRLANDGLDETAPSRSIQAEHPASPRRTLTPLNSRTPGDSIEL